MGAGCYGGLGGCKPGGFKVPSVLDARISELDLGVTIESKLGNAGVRTVRQLVALTEDEAAALPGIGKRSLKHIRDAAKAMGVKFRVQPSREKAMRQGMKAKDTRFPECHFFIVARLGGAGRR